MSIQRMGYGLLMLAALAGCGGSQYSGAGTATAQQRADVQPTVLLSTVSSNTVRNCIMFVKSGLYLGLWKDMEINVTQRMDLTGLPWQLYSMLSAGARPAFANACRKPARRASFARSSTSGVVT